MATQQEKTTTPSDRPSFFGMPSSSRFWLQVGPRFWGGALMGLGWGIFLCVTTMPQSGWGWWGVISFSVLWMIGFIITNRDINRTRERSEER
jgi:hypothetical protein